MPMKIAATSRIAPNSKRFAVRTLRLVSSQLSPARPNSTPSRRKFGTIHAVPRSALPGTSSATAAIASASSGMFTAPSSAKRRWVSDRWTASRSFLKSTVSMAKYAMSRSPLTMIHSFQSDIVQRNGTPRR